MMDSIPRPESPKGELRTIEGMVPSIFSMPKGCKFCTRCRDVFEPCRDIEPDLLEVRPGHAVRCHKYKEGKQL